MVGQGKTIPAQLFTIGFTQKSAERFFSLLRETGVKRVIDIRGNSESQLSGFAKGRDLGFLLKAILGVDYLYLPLLAPSREIRDAFRRDGDWLRYQGDFCGLMEARKAIESINPETLAGACLLCAEAAPDQCHRRLVAERIAVVWPWLEIRHLQ